MDKRTKGAWIVHHGRKVAADVRGASEYSAIDFAAKTASLLARLAETQQSVLTNAQVVAAAKVGGLNPKTELESCLSHLVAKNLVDRSKSGISVLGVTGRTALTHAADLFEDNDPQPIEHAAVAIAEIASLRPIRLGDARELIGDTFKFTKADTSDFIDQSAQIGFVDVEGAQDDRILFNGNLFRRDTAEKTKKILDSLSSGDQAKMREFDSLLQLRGSVTAGMAERVLGNELFSKLKAAAVYDMNVVSNEAGDHVFITAPGSFHKFSDPMTDDAFDHAKALVAALSYGMSLSASGRGRIWSIGLLLGKLLRNGEIGPATAIGQDYQALEAERVVQIRDVGGGRYMMRLLKREIGEIALSVLQGGDGATKALETLPSAGMRSYTPPEVARTQFRRKTQSAPSRAQTRTLLSAIRGGGTI
jgi:hypothetical protein